MLLLNMVKQGTKERKPRSLMKDALRRLSRNSAAVVGGVIVLALLILAVGANWIAPYH